jgi:quinoprotein glucose dehydrogenase
MYLFSNSLTRLLGLSNDPQRSDMDFIQASGGGDTGGGGRFPGCNLMPCAITVQGLPFVKPPWGRITAIDLNKGEIVWQIPHGETPGAVTNHPMLKGVNLPRTGRIGPIGTLTTKTFVISGERGFTTGPDGQRFAKLYAYDKATGRELASLTMPALTPDEPDPLWAHRRF